MPPGPRRHLLVGPLGPPSSYLSFICSAASNSSISPFTLPLVLQGLLGTYIGVFEKLQDGSGCPRVPGQSCFWGFLGQHSEQVLASTWQFREMPELGSGILLRGPLYTSFLYRQALFLSFLMLDILIGSYLGRTHEMKFHNPG